MPMKALCMLLIVAAWSPAEEWKQLFNQRDMTGWKMVGTGRFVVEDGMLKTEGGMGLLWYTGEKFGDATLRVVFKTATEHANSGVYIRLAEINEFVGDQPVPPRKQWYEPVRGPRPDSGYIGLQNHDAKSTVYFREVSVRR